MGWQAPDRRAVFTIGAQASVQDRARPASAEGMPAPSPSVWIGRLSLTAFRSYETAELSLDSRLVAIDGPNGAGKTNLLEAVSLLAPGRGLRQARLGDIQCAAAETPWAVAAEVGTPAGPAMLGTGRDPQTPESERRVIRVDGRNERSQQALAEILDVIWLTPQMDGLWRESASARRRFLDRLVFAFDPAHAGRINGYESLLRQRMRLLQERNPDGAWLDSLETGLAERGIAIAAARRAAVARLVAADARSFSPAFPRVGLNLEGAVDDWLQEGSALAAEDRLREALAASRRRDGESGRAHFGPHRSDLLGTHLAKDCPAGLASTGEQKALLIGLILAHTRLLALERRRRPILLLDEVAAHLDRQRRAALYEELLALECQAWLTGTDSEIFAPLGERMQRISIGDGSAIRYRA